MKIPTFPSALFLAGSLYLVAAVNGRAAMVGFTTTDTSPTLPGDYGLNAMVFTITTPITVDALGFYAYSLGGGDQPVVDLYSVVTTGGTTAATQLATTGPIAQSSTTTGQFNYFSITPQTLLAGTYMVAGGLYFAPVFANTTPSSGIVSESFYRTASDFFGSGASNHFDPNGYATAVSVGGATVEDFPLSPGSAEGVNFEYTSALNIPEPSTYALIGLGCWVCAVAYRRSTKNLLG